MVLEIQGGSRPNLPSVTPQVRAQATPAVQDPIPANDPHAAQAQTVEAATPKVQPPKPVEIKVDLEKMRANLQESLQKFNETMRDGGRNLNFQIDDKLGGLVVQVKNADTGEVVRQIPADVVVRMAHNIEAFKGVLLNELT